MGDVIDGKAFTSRWREYHHVDIFRVLWIYFGGISRKSHLESHSDLDSKGSLPA